MTAKAAGWRGRCSVGFVASPWVEESWVIGLKVSFAAYQPRPPAVRARSALAAGFLFARR